LEGGIKLSSEKTTNLKLHRWLGTDNVLRSEFNFNFEELDIQFYKDRVQLLESQVENIGVGVHGGLDVLDSATPDMNVHVQTGVIYMPNGQRYEFSTIKTISIVAADATNPRKDIIYVSDLGVITYSDGTPGTTPSEPILPSGAHKLCVIDVPAGDTAIEQTQITDSRSMLRNLDAVDQKVNEHLADYEQQMSRQTTLNQSLVHGTQIINGTQASPLNVEFKGKTLVNLLGKQGNFEGTWDFYASPTYQSISTAKYFTGLKSAEVNADNSAGTSNFVAAGRSDLVTSKSSAYYLAVVRVWIDSTSVLGTGSEVDFYIEHLDDTNARVGITKKVIDKTKTNQWQYVYIKKTSESTATKMRVLAPYVVVVAGDKALVYYDSASIYELTAEQFNEIGVSLTDADVERLFPYVDSVQHVKNPVLTVEGDNLIPPFTEWTLHANATVKSPYELELNVTNTAQVSDAVVSAVGDQSYSFTLTHNGYVTIMCLDSNGVELSRPFNYSTVQTGSFTSHANTKSIRFRIGNNAETTGTFTFKNPMFNLGSTAKPFVERNPSYLYAETVLAGNTDKKDILTKNEDLNRWEINPKWFEPDKVMDGSLGWEFVVDQFGRKVVRTSNAFTDAERFGKTIVIDYNGSPMIQSSDTWGTANSVHFASTLKLELNVSDVDSGWLQYEKPRTDDIKGMMYGWKANGYTLGTDVLDEATGSLASGGTYNLLNTGSLRNIVVEKSSDNTTWSAATEGTDYTLSWASGTGTMTLTNATAGALYFRVDYNYGYSVNSWQSLVDGTAPSTNTLAYVSANMAPNFTPYELTYQLADSVIETVTVEGALKIDGLAQAEVDSGFTVNIDADGNRTYTMTSDSERYKETCNITELKVEYASNLGTVVSQNVKNIEDLQTNDSVQNWDLTHIDAKVTNLRKDHESESYVPHDNGTRYTLHVDADGLYLKEV
jgi:hypothetical protein